MAAEFWDRDSASVGHQRGVSLLQSHLDRLLAVGH